SFHYYLNSQNGPASTLRCSDIKSHQTSAFPSPDIISLSKMLSKKNKRNEEKKKDGCDFRV
ncbi:hypothetical protein STEG23_019679, partial [Scotinomys teguina]